MIGRGVSRYFVRYGWRVCAKLCSRADELFPPRDRVKGVESWDISEVRWHFSDGQSGMRERGPAEEWARPQACYE